MYKKIIAAWIICLAAAVPLYAAESVLIEEVSRESLLVPESAFIDEAGTLDISKWGIMEPTGKTGYVRSTVMHGLALYMSGTDSPRKLWNTVPPVYMGCSRFWCSRAEKMSVVCPTGSRVELV